MGDVRDVCFESPTSGLIKALGGKIGGEGRLMEKGPHIYSWSRSTCQLRLRNGSIVYGDGADDGAYRIQGHNLRGVWCEELGLWQKWKAAFDESIRYAVRMPPAKVLITGTPKRTQGARVLVERLINDDSVLNVQLWTEENIHNLDPAAAAEFMASKGTSLERQELYGDLLTEVEGSLLTREKIEMTRVLYPLNERGVPTSPLEDDPFMVKWVFEQIHPTRIGLAIDPAVTFSEESDKHGMVVVAKGRDGDLYILEDATQRCPVTRWPHIAMDLYAKWQCDRIIGEVNNGGDYIKEQLHAAGYRGGIEVVRATRGKEVRAQPVATYWEREHVHVVGEMPGLESDWVTWVPGEGMDSPDALDACVYACSWLVPSLQEGWASVYKAAADVPGDEKEPAPTRGWGTVYQRKEDPFESLRQMPGQQQPV